eukprot:7762782-Lingulodinium_polyedra.AAC.1
MVRVGMKDLLRLVDARAALVANGLSELNRTLAHAVQAHWRRMAALGLAIPHDRPTYDVWDMLRGGAT